MARCVACGSTVEFWLALDGDAFLRSAFGEAIDSIGSDLSRFWCPHCRSTDRDRHLILYLDAVGATADLAGADVLHLAPEAAISSLIRQRGPRRYVRGDLQPAADDIERIDLESLPFADASFDYVICNHVLEHVHSVARALAEVARVLRPGGRFICQTPYARRLTTTFEDPELQSEADRVFFYGQNDHVRRFGRDIGAIIRGSGFHGALRGHAEMLGEIDGAALGVNEREPFFDFVRDATCAAPQAARAADSSVAAAPRLATQIRALIDGATAPGRPPTGDYAAADDGDHTQYAAASAAIAAGDVTGAIAALIDLATRCTPLAKVYADLGDLAADGGDPAAAIDLYRAAADRAAAPARPLVKLGGCLLADGQRDAALAAAGEALRHDPADAEALHLARTIVAPKLSTLAWLRLVADLRHEQARLNTQLAELERTLAAIGEIASAALFKDNI